MRRTAERGAGARLSLTLIMLGLILSLGVALLLYLRVLPTGVPGQWEWPWRDPSDACPTTLFLIPLLYLVPVLALFRLQARARLSRGAAAGFIVLCCAVAATSMVGLESAEPAAPLHLSASTASMPAIGYFSYATALTDLRPLLGVLSNRRAQAPPLPPRVGTHPPGPVLFCYAGLRVLDRLPGVTAAVEEWLERQYGLSREGFQAVSRWTAMPSVQPRHLVPALLIGLTMTLLGSLLPLPAYFVLSALHSRKAALVAALCAATIPSLVVFMPSIDGVAAVLALTAVALWLWALRRGAWWLHVVAGLALADAVSWSIGLCAVAVAMAVAGLPWLRRQRCRARAVRGFLTTAGSFVGVFLLLYLVWGYSLPGNVRLMAHWQRAEMVRANRDYLTWLPGNLYDVMLLMGPALLFIACAALPMVHALRRWSRHYVLGAFLALVLVWLSGSTLGEVGRIWLFLMALLVPGAALVLVELPAQKVRPLLVLLVLSQTCLTVLLHCRLGFVSP